MIGLDQTGTVYTPHATTGDYTVVDKSGLECRLARVTVAVAAGGERVELVEKRVLLFDPAYSVPATAQVEIGSNRYNVQRGTVAYPRGPAGSAVYGRCDVIEAE